MMMILPLLLEVSDTQVPSVPRHLPPLPPLPHATTALATEQVPQGPSSFTLPPLPHDTTATCHHCHMPPGYHSATVTTTTAIIPPLPPSHHGCHCHYCHHCHQATTATRPPLSLLPPLQLCHHCPGHRAGSSRAFILHISHLLLCGQHDQCPAISPSSSLSEHTEGCTVWPLGSPWTGPGDQSWLTKCKWM